MDSFPREANYSQNFVVNAMAPIVAPQGGNQEYASALQNLNHGAASALVSELGNSSNGAEIQKPTIQRVITKQNSSGSALQFDNSVCIVGGRPVYPGTKVVIRGAECLHHRLQHYARTIGEIEDVPVHPNTWFGIRLHDRRKVKIRKSGFDIIQYLPVSMENAAKVSSTIQNSASSVTHSELMDIEGNCSSSLSKMASAREKEFPLTGSPSVNDEKLADEGSTRLRVRIVKSEDVQNKCPWLAGIEGEIIDFPRHPNTWYKIKLVNGKIVKLRRSSIKFLSDVHNSTDDALQKKPNQVKKQGVVASSLSQYSSHSDNLIGKKALILKGTFQGYSGEIVDLFDEKVRINLGNQEAIKKLTHVACYNSPGILDYQSMSNNLKFIEIGSSVSIVSGRYAGCKGIVRKESNGFYSIEILENLFQEKEPVMALKRITELAVVRDTNEGEVSDKEVSMEETDRIVDAAKILLAMMGLCPSMENC